MDAESAWVPANYSCIGFNTFITPVQYFLSSFYCAFQTLSYLIVVKWLVHGFISNPDMIPNVFSVTSGVKDGRS